MLIALYKYFYVKKYSDCGQTPRRCLRKVSLKPFQRLVASRLRKGGRRAHAAKFPARRCSVEHCNAAAQVASSFCQAFIITAETRTPCLRGAFAAKCHRLSLSSRRMFCACAVKEKAGYQFSIRNILLSIYFVINLNIFYDKKFAVFKNAYCG